MKKAITAIVTAVLSLTVFACTAFAATLSVDSASYANGTLTVAVSGATAGDQISISVNDSSSVLKANYVVTLASASQTITKTPTLTAGSSYTVIVNDVTSGTSAKTTFTAQDTTSSAASSSASSTVTSSTSTSSTTTVSSASSASTSTATSAVTTSTASSKASNPKTGDASVGVVAVAVLAAAAVGTSLVAAKKAKKNK